jgi:hypothetical protein
LLGNLKELGLPFRGQHFAYGLHYLVVQFEGQVLFDPAFERNLLVTEGVPVRLQLAQFRKHFGVGLLLGSDI